MSENRSLRDVREVEADGYRYPPVTPFTLIDPITGQRYWRLPDTQKFSYEDYLLALDMSSQWSSLSSQLKEKMEESRFENFHSSVKRYETANKICLLASVGTLLFGWLIYPLAGLPVSPLAGLYGTVVAALILCSKPQARRYGLCKVSESTSANWQLCKERDWKEFWRQVNDGFNSHLLQYEPEAVQRYHKLCRGYSTESLWLAMNKAILTASSKDAQYWVNIDDQQALTRRKTHEGNKNQRPNNPGGFSQPATRAELDGDAGLPKLRL